MKKKFIFLCYSTYLVLGSYQAVNMALTSFVSNSVNGGNALTGILVSAIYAGSLLFVALTGAVSDRAGKRLCAVLTASLVFVGSLLLFIAQNAILYVIAFVLVGGGLGSFEGVALALLGDLLGDGAGQYISRTNIFFSMGAVVAPAIASWWMTRGSYRTVFAVFMVLSLVIMIIYGSYRKIDSFAIKITDKKRTALSDFINIIRKPAMLLIMTSMMCYIAVESAFTYWAVQYTQELGFMFASGIIISVFWIAGMIGVYLSSMIKNFSRFLPLCFIIAGISIILEALVPGEAAKLVFAFMIGVSCSPMYSNINFVGGHMFPENSGMAYSLMLLAASLGGIVAQPLIGVISNYISISQVFILFGIISLASSIIPYLAVKK